MTERVRLVNLPRQMLSEFPGSFGVQGEQSQQPKPPTSWTLSTAHRYAPAFPSVADIGNGYVLTSSAGEVKKAGGSKRKLQLSPTLSSRTKCARSQHATSRRAVSGP